LTTCEAEVVAALREALTQRIGEPRYRLWFQNNTRFRRDDCQLVVGVPNCFFQDWLQKTFAEDVRAAASAVFGSIAAVRFVIDPQLFQAARQAEREAQSGERQAPSAERQAPSAEPRAPGATYAPDRDDPAGMTRSPQGGAPRSALRAPRRWRRLGDFVAGACNRVAHASAVSIVEEPGQAASPLVLHGPVGTGKTHLLEGIYGGLRRSQPEWRLSFITAEEFTNRFVQAMRLGKLGSFRKHFRECDALFIDDLHFLATKKATQEEFLHTFDALQADGKHLVATCDCHPKLSDDFCPELTDRLLAGAVWGLAVPDPATRLEILRQLGVKAEPVVPEDVVRFLAGQLRGNVRELEGALHSVRHVSRVAGRAVDVALAREAVGELLRHSVRVLRLADIGRAVCQVLRLEPGTLQSKGRGWAVSHPRMLAMYLARKHTAATYGEIGHYFGGRNHSTVVAAEKKMRTWIERDTELALGQLRMRVRAFLELAERALEK